MHEFMVNCLYILVIALSILGITGVILILTGAVKGVIDLINHKNDEE
jgi:hypothetical protein